MITYLTIPEFDRDFKKLAKRYNSLDKDFDVMKRFSIETCFLQGIDNGSIVPIQGFCGDDYTSNKVRKFACMSLRNKGNRSGIRVIFVHEPQDKKITFIEIYCKSDQANENRERLKSFIAKLDG